MACKRLFKCCHAMNLIKFYFCAVNLGLLKALSTIFMAGIIKYTTRSSILLSTVKRLMKVNVVSLYVYYLIWFVKRRLRSKKNLYQRLKSLKIFYMGIELFVNSRYNCVMLILVNKVWTGHTMRALNLLQQHSSTVMFVL